jgi:signal transduction histidine kinase
VRARPQLFDVLVPAAIAALGTVELALTAPPAWGYGVALELLACGLLTARRRWPLVVAPAAAAVVLLMPWFGPQLEDVATPILVLALACFSLGRRVDDLRGLVGIGLIGAMLLVDYTLVDLRSHDVTDVVFVSTLLVPPFVFGRIARRLAVQAEQLRLHQAAERDRALREERDRIARDLHDVLAHSLSAMTVQTAAAQDLVRSDPARAEALLTDVAATGRRALHETGRLLHVLRDEDGELGLRPAPGVADLPALVEEFRGRGLDVRAELPSSGLGLPGGVDVSAYRIAQEVLTNALRYAPDRSAEISVRAADGVLTIVTSNGCDGRTGAGSGLGLLGVAERVKVLGGTLWHGSRQGRFELRATLPLAGS